MLENHNIKLADVKGSLGDALTLETLPSPATNRWVVHRKAEVVAAVNVGLLSIEQACERYSLSIEEFDGWQRAVERWGIPGLLVTRLKNYREKPALEWIRAASLR